MTDTQGSDPAGKPSNQPQKGSAQQGNDWLEPGASNVQLIYILFFLGFVVGITAIVGVILAYVNRGKTNDYVETHYTWLIRTFWIGVLFSVISVVLSIVAIGILLGIATFIWLVIRLIKGLQALGRNEPIANPLTWWI